MTKQEFETALLEVWGLPFIQREEAIDCYDVWDFYGSFFPSGGGDPLLVSIMYRRVTGNMIQVGLLVHATRGVESYWADTHDYQKAFDQLKKWINA